MTPAEPSTTSAVAASVSGSTEPVASPAVNAAAAQTPAAPSRPGPITVHLKKDTVIGIRIDQPISTDSSHAEDRISARVSRDVVVDGTTAIPAGTRVEGLITRVERPTPANPRGKLGVRFTAIVRADNTRVAIGTETIYREASDAAIGNGASYDVNAFSAVVAGGRNLVPTPPASGRSASNPTPAPARLREAQLPAGAPLTLHLTAAVSITVDRDPQ